MRCGAREAGCGLRSARACRRGNEAQQLAAELLQVAEGTSASDGWRLSSYRSRSGKMADSVVEGIMQDATVREWTKAKSFDKATKKIEIDRSTNELLQEFVEWCQNELPHHAFFSTFRTRVLFFEHFAFFLNEVYRPHQGVVWSIKKGNWVKTSSYKRSVLSENRETRKRKEKAAKAKLENIDAVLQAAADLESVGSVDSLDGVDGAAPWQ